MTISSDPIITESELHGQPVIEYSSESGAADGFRVLARSITNG